MDRRSATSPGQYGAARDARPARTPTSLGVRRLGECTPRPARGLGRRVVRTPRAGGARTATSRRDGALTESFC
jgi:hypothetical protein